MKQKSRIASKLFAVLVVLTLISCCFLGTTFARYTSTGSGTSTVTVAAWDVEFGQPESAPVSLGMISPDDTEYNSEKHQTDPRSNKGNKVLVATITNNSDVKATITIDIGGITLTGYSGEWGDEYTSETQSSEGDPTQNQVLALFSVKYYYDKDDTDTDTADNATDEISDVTEIPLDVGSTTPTVLKIYAQVTWTSADATLQAASDYLDTWVGQNITRLSSTLTFTAVQASEQPNT